LHEAATVSLENSGMPPLSAASAIPAVKTSAAARPMADRKRFMGHALLLFILTRYSRRAQPTGKLAMKKVAAVAMTTVQSHRCGFMPPLRSPAQSLLAQRPDAGDAAAT